MMPVSPILRLLAQVQTAKITIQKGFAIDRGQAGRQAASVSSLSDKFRNSGTRDLGNPEKRALRP